MRQLHERVYEFYREFSQVAGPFVLFGLFQREDAAGRWDLVVSAETRGLQARAGVAAGTVLALDGDYFGPVVNLAARLVSLAEAGDVLASESVIEWLGDRRESESLGTRTIRGFDEPVAVARLTRTR